MPRRVLNVVTILSLLVCVAVAVLWVRSYLPHESFVFNRDGRLILVFAEGDRSIDLRPRALVPPRGFDPGQALANIRAVARTHWSFLGIEFVAGPTDVAVQRGNFEGEYRLLAVPYIYLFLIPAAAAGWLLWVLRRNRQRARHGLCARCGYDLRATPGKCPECGEVSGAATLETRVQHQP